VCVRVRTRAYVIHGEIGTYRVRVCTGTDCREGRGVKGLRERPMVDRTCACVYLCIMKPVQTNEPGGRGGGVLSSVLLYIGTLQPPRAAMYITCTRV
jgi:hypothetical protein